MTNESLFQRAGGYIWGHKRSIGFGLETLGLLTLKYPRIVAALAIALTVLCAIQIPRLSVDGDLLRIYTNSGEHYDRYAALSETFGTFEGDIYVLVNSPTLTEPSVLERVRELAFELELNEFAAGTMSPFTLRKPTDDGSTVPAVPEGMTSPDQVSAALTDLQQNDPIMRNLIVPDLSGVVLIMFPNPDLIRGDGTKRMIASLRDIVERYEIEDVLEIELTGPPIWTSEMLSASLSDQTTFTGYGFLLGIVISLLAFRNIWLAMLVAVTPAISVLWVLGTVTLIFGSFSFLTIIVTTLVLVMAFAESLFFCFTWVNNWRDGMDPRAAIHATVRKMAPAAALSILTTIVAFASLSTTPGQGVGEFAWAGVLGCALAFVALLTVLPLVMLAAIRLGLKMPGPVSIALTAPVPVALGLATRFGRPIAIAAVIMTLLLVIPYFLIQPRFSFESMMADNSAALEAADAIDSGVGGVAPLYISVPLEEAVSDVGDADFETIQAVHNILEAELGQGKVISAASFTHYADSGFTREQIFDAVGPFMKRRFITDDGTQALVTGFLPTVVDSQSFLQLVETLEAQLDEAGIEATIGGFRALTTFGTDSIVRNLQLALAGSVVVNLFLIGFAFRSWRLGLVSVIPNLFPILGTEAYLWAAGYGLELVSVIALTIAFGIAVDDTIHFLSHYQRGRLEEKRGHLDAVRHTMERIGGAIVATTVILCAGTFIVIFSDLPQVALFGELFVGALVLALIGDLFLLPALLHAGGKFFDPVGTLPRGSEPELVPVPSAAGAPERS